MPDNYRVLDQRQVSTTAGTVYTAPTAPGMAIVKSMRIVNTSGAACWVALWQGGTGAANAILPQVTVDPGGFAEFEGTLTMAGGTTLAAQAQTATSITLTIYGLEIT